MASSSTTDLNGTLTADSGSVNGGGAITPTGTNQASLDQSGEGNRWIGLLLLASIPILKSISVVLKVGMLGDSQVGKTSLMVKYVEGSWDEDYIQTLGWFKLR